MMEAFYENEDRDNIRFNWNIFPRNKIQQTKNIIPVGAMYAPMKMGTHTMKVTHDPLKCTSCKAYLNPYCPVNFNNYQWRCIFCSFDNKLPPSYATMTPDNPAPEILPTSTTIDYILNEPTGMPAFLFVLDTCLPKSQMDALKESILQTIDLLPSSCYVGLITFGNNVQVYALNSFPCPNIFSFSGNEEVTPFQVHNFLRVGLPLSRNRVQASINNDFIVNLKSNKKLIKATIKNILEDPFEVQNSHRPHLATGAAISVAIGLAENTFSGLGLRIMMFMGGPASKGPGSVVSHELKETIRTHNEIRKEVAPHVHKATKFYNQLAQRAALNGHTVDLFSCSMNQTGLLEMKSLCKSTGGIMVLSDGFECQVFQETLFKMFAKDENGNLSMAFNGTMSVVTSNNLGVSGCIGHVISGENNDQVADTQFGIGGSSWKLCSFDENTHYAIFFDIKGKTDPGQPYANIQFQTTYRHGSGVKVLRITTVSRPWATNDEPISALPGFDQEACAALFARHIIYRCENDDIEPLSNIDQSIIKLFQRFCQYTKGSPQSLSVPQEFSLYTNFIYYFRRCPLVQVFNNSPDETVYFRYCLFRESVSNILVMMQPTLESYTLDQDPQPVLLSSRSISTENILLLDTFFHIVIHTGATIAQWRNQGYHEDPEYENIKELLTMPKEDAQELMSTRLPLPIYVECDQYTSQARFLVATVDPSFTHLDAPTGNPNGEGQMVFTEDVSLNFFFEKLAKFVVGEK